MKPAPSIIGFTTASGLGYGMLFVLAMGGVSGLLPTERWFGVVSFFLALGAITGGLFASTLHLGHPKRAWRAITQWRSSWLSREGLLAIITYIPALLLATSWIVDEAVIGIYALTALGAAISATATVYCTGMIYASLPPIKAWHQPLTAPLYLAFALTTGLLAVHLLLIIFGSQHLFIGILTLIAIIVTSLLKLQYWRTTLKSQSGQSSSTGSATGLGSSDLVRMLDPPHTQTNYLLDEMGFQIGRKHARMLRMLYGLFGSFMPLVLTLTAIFQGQWLAMTLAFFAFVSAIIGVLIERWLFFAEAEHTAMLYYGQETVPALNERPKEAEKKPSVTPATSSIGMRRRRTP